MPTNRIIRVSYSGPESTYIIPKDLPLLSKEDNDKACRTASVVPFSWWIKWDTFHYYDKDGNEQTLQKDRETEVDCKYPENVEEDEEEDEEEVE